MLENHNWSSISGSASAPYINSLLTTAAHAEAYYNPPGNHPSLPNYLWLEAGSNLGVLNDNDPSQNHQSTTAHLVNQLEAAGYTWKAYEEGISGTGCPLTNSGLYSAHHDPFVYFDDVTSNLSPTSPRCLAHVRPLDELAGDLAAGTIANYNFITPNLCHDMSGDFSSCSSTTSDLVRLADDWLSATVPMITGSAAFQTGGVLFITWDEGAGTVSASDGPIGMIVVSPRARAGYSNSLRYDHSSTLRTVQELFGVGPYLGNAASAADLSDLFTAFP